MGFDQYHEPAEELSAETRTFARMIASLTEEAEAIGWYGGCRTKERIRPGGIILRDDSGMPQNFPGVGSGAGVVVAAEPARVAA